MTEIKKVPLSDFPFERVIVAVRIAYSRIGENREMMASFFVLFCFSPRLKET